MIKLAPVARELGDRATLVHTGQHFDSTMSQTLLYQLGLGEPDVRLDVGGRTRGAQIGAATIAVEELLLEREFAAVVVQGDTNSGLAGALAANAAEVPLVHLEAGLRSFDRRMPEEHNRVLIDALADLCCAPHQSNAKLLEQEGVSPERIAITGSTLSDAVYAMMPSAEDRSDLLRSFGYSAGEYVVATIHRAENADHPDRLEAILTALANLDRPVLLPLHPRTRRRVAEFGLGSLLDRMMVVEPLGYTEFLAVAADCALLVSDSGGVQEEATIVRRPVVIVRDSTERPEIVGTFAHLVGAGSDISVTANALLADIESVHATLAELPYPYGDDATKRCVEAIDRLLPPP